MLSWFAFSERKKPIAKGNTYCLASVAAIFTHWFIPDNTY